MTVYLNPTQKSVTEVAIHFTNNTLSQIGYANGSFYSISNMPTNLTAESSGEALKELIPKYLYTQSKNLNLDNSAASSLRNCVSALPKGTRYKQRLTSILNKQLIASNTATSNPPSINNTNPTRKTHETPEQDEIQEMKGPSQPADSKETKTPNYAQPRFIQNQRMAGMGLIGGGVLVGLVFPPVAFAAIALGGILIGASLIQQVVGGAEGCQRGRAKRVIAGAFFIALPVLG